MSERITQQNLSASTKNSGEDKIKSPDDEMTLDEKFEEINRSFDHHEELYQAFKEQREKAILFNFDDAIDFLENNQSKFLYLSSQAVFALMINYARYMRGLVPGQRIKNVAMTPNSKIKLDKLILLLEKEFQPPNAAQKAFIETCSHRILADFS
jgi:hypothetical protein